MSKLLTYILPKAQTRLQLTSLSSALRCLLSFGVDLLL